MFPTKFKYLFRLNKKSIRNLLFFNCAVYNNALPLGNAEYYSICDSGEFVTICGKFECRFKNHFFLRDFKKATGDYSTILSFSFEAKTKIYSVRHELI